MLLSLTLMAIVGGAVAFRAKKLQEYCYTTQYDPIQGLTTCNLQDGFTNIGPDRFWIYTTTPVGIFAACSYFDGHNFQPITCFASALLKED